MRPRANVRSDVSSWSWSCKNVVVIALIPGDFGDVGARGHYFHGCQLFCLEALLMRIVVVLGSSATADGRRLAADYALIAAMSGWTPKMFMTRVRL
jgi:hypothetical protein